MPFKLVPLLLLLYRGYRRLPSSQRRRLRGVASQQGLRIARRHGPRVADSLLRRARGRA